MKKELKRRLNINLYQTRVPIIDWQRFSKYTTILRVMVWVQRFCLACREGRQSSESGGATEKIKLGDGFKIIKCINGSEMDKAEMSLVRLLQIESYPEEIEALGDGRSMKASSRIASLRPIYDQHRRIVRVTGRVEASFRLLGISFPILLPGNHRFSRLLIEATHQRLMHLGYKTTWSEVKRRFWIVNGRALVKKTLSKCVKCKQRHARHFKEEAASLPEARVREADPFEVVGVDYAGPLFYWTNDEAGGGKRENILSKSTRVDIVIFTCAVTRALHIELVDDLKAYTFILALRRLHAATDGTISVIYSDNAKVFHKASKYLISLSRSSRLQDYLANNRIEWRYSASRAPWWGGFWEIMVKTTKDLLIKSFSHSRMSRDALHTALKEVEAAINSRPLAYVLAYVGRRTDANYSKSSKLRAQKEIGS